jgi:hypothetical protein
MRLWPLVAVLSLAAFVGIFILSSDDLLSRLGNRTASSEALFLVTIAYAIASIASVVTAWRASAETVRPRVRRFSKVVAVALLVAAAYFAYWGMIGLRTWA